tara:strand:+ start:4521 stop:4955 length:435 start_codon:yes stop_codon:yes gene_type:complete
MDSDFDSEEQEGRNPLRDRNKLLEAENAELRAQAEAASSAARELAFVKAGIDPDLPISKYFVKAYDGELTADAIREAGIEAGLLKDTEAESIKQEAGTWNRTNDIAAGSETEPQVDFVTRIAQARSQAEVEKLLDEARAQSEVL